jgi:hypothetical protein
MGAAADQAATPIPKGLLAIINGMHIWLANFATIVASAMQRLRMSFRKWEIGSQFPTF